ncbi:MAG: hypothetical protein QXP81_10945 [Nitrososphaerota archaeon]
MAAEALVAPTRVVTISPGETVVVRAAPPTTAPPITRPREVPAKPPEAPKPPAWPTPTPPTGIVRILPIGWPSAAPRAPAAAQALGDLRGRVKNALVSIRKSLGLPAEGPLIRFLGGTAMEGYEASAPLGYEVYAQPLEEYGIEAR